MSPTLASLSGGLQLSFKSGEPATQLSGSACNIKGFLADKPDLTLTINRSDLEQTMMGAKTLEAQIAAGTAKVEGDAGILTKLASTMVEFDPRFEINARHKGQGT